jgi:hypothetical protein
MALPIATIPVLTGEVAERFEAEAQKNYEHWKNRTSEEKRADEEAYQKGMEKLHRMLAHAHIYD